MKVEGRREGRSRKCAATLAVCAIVAGVAYTLSPLSVICALWMALVIRWTTHDIAGRERRWVLTTLAVALALRVVAIAALPFLVDPRRQAYVSYFGDAQYAIQRSIWIRNIFLGIPVAPRDHIEAFEPVLGYSGYNYLLAYLQVLWGPSPYGLAAVSTAVFLTVAAALYRVCRGAFGQVSALGGLLLLVLSPTWIAWSVTPLKEPMQVLLLAVTPIAGMTIVRGPVRSRIWASLALVATLILSARLREGAVALSGLSIVVGLALWLGTRRWWAAPAVAAALVLAVIVGVRSTAIRTVVVSEVRRAALRHLGHVLSPGTTYRVLDTKFYARPQVDTTVEDFAALSLGESARFLIRATAAFFVQPLPSTFDSFKWLAFVPAQVLWLAGSALAFVGAFAGFWRRPPLAAGLIGAAVAVVVVVAPNSGNVGTLLRHRDIMTPFVTMLAGVGGVALLQRFAGLRPAAAVSPDKVVAPWH